MADGFKPCSVDGCNGNANHNARGRRGMCNAHYLRQMRHGDPAYGGAIRVKYGPTCTVAGCGKKTHGCGYCDAHYERWRKYGDPMAGSTPWGATHKFYYEVVLPYDGYQCLIWPFARNANGYALFHGHELNTAVASRAVCFDIFGPPPTPEHQAAHSCGKGHEGCVSPKHLSWKTPSDNQMDRVDHGTSTRGSNHGLSKLTADDVRKIRSLRGRMKQQQIAEMFGISRAQVCAVQKRKAWRWLP